VSTLTGLISSGGGGGIDQDNYFYFIDKSGTFSAPFSGEIDIYCIGAGGSGEAAKDVNSGGNKAGTGGGAGGTAIKKSLAVTAGDTFTIVVGAGGTIGAHNNSPNANAGGSTSVNSNDVTCALTANGGGAGQVDGTGASGGTGSGGDLNFTGGDSGLVNLDGTGNYKPWRASGGGAVGLASNGFSSGSITGGGNRPGMGATGGAGLGGSSVSLSIGSNSSDFYGVSGGGGGLGEGGAALTGNSNNALNLTSEGGLGFFDADTTRPSTTTAYFYGRSEGTIGVLYGQGSNNNVSTSDAGIGGGGGGSYLASNNSGDGGAFAGGGGFRGTSNAVAGYGGYGGGGGGGLECYPGAGGSGCVIVIYNSLS